MSGEWISVAYLCSVCSCVIYECAMVTGIVQQQQQQQQKSFYCFGYVVKYSADDAVYRIKLHNGLLIIKNYELESSIPSLWLQM